MNSVCHKILLHKCSKLNIDSFWFQDYLSNRTQSVRINKTVSKTATLSYGVPQGSILGPILFTIYVNDMSKEVSNCVLVQYADDTQLLHTGTIDDVNTLIKNTESSLCQLKTYFHRNGLMINADKTQCIFIGTRQLMVKVQDNYVIKFDGKNITPCKQVKQN